MSPRLVYIAGPYRARNTWDLARNVWRAREAAAAAISRAGVYPVLPHATHGFDDLAEETFWATSTMELMRRCDAVLLIDGWEESEGSRAEQEEATRLQIPVFADVENLRRWAWLEAQRT